MSRPAWCGLRLQLHSLLPRMLLCVGLVAFSQIGRAQDAPAALPYSPDAIPLSQYQSGDAESSSVPDPSAPYAISTVPQGKEYFLAIYSGSTSGVYYYVASAICDTLSMTYRQHHIRCVALRSQGVGSNRDLMTQGRAQMIIVQSDTNYYASNGEKPIPGARSVMSLHNEMGVLVVSKNSDIHGVADLRGKRVNLGPEGSASRNQALELLAAYGLKPADLGRADAVTQDANSQGLCSGYIDAFPVWIGHPAQVVDDVARFCGARLVGMNGDGMENLLHQHQYYSHQTLPANLYPGQDQSIESYGFKASLVAYEPVKPYIVYWLTRSLMEHLDVLRAKTPNLSMLNAREMFEVGNFLPFHEGAARYWREIGWLQDGGPKGPPDIDESADQ
ncbi:TAXI family TRAP transporter solute-binding subunit [Pokkaliibacter sp. MBI-7]|uniref:TAXI family TRAP transporter solute-binding subunit n=1 Tax=Pokkaliibacter sp. MBI-7 TaxID=3040600 RepID=UPI00244A0D11|nr:TAXI family TRAP transporter solute-binding subunit [Pokkaliibacter sp. MBI-7]MDH2434863.1 TAXI family TRAP transporter solute-binding subunit [Pokkaliibacter sp. MBI-7]